MRSSRTICASAASVTLTVERHCAPCARRRSEYFSEFPGATLCEGWIPDVFAKLPTTAWSFVHLDLTLYEPTLAALQYFYPALSTGGVIVCDGSLFCPGVQQALDEFSATSGAAYVTLGYREAVFMKA